MLYGIRILREEADKGNGGGAPAQDADAVKAQLAKADAERKEALARADALEKKEKDREAARKKAERDSQQFDMEKAKAELAEREKELEVLRAKNSAAEKRETERIEKMIAEMPEENRAKVLKFKDKMDLNAWAELVEDEAGPVRTKQGAPPVLQSGARDSKMGHQVSAKAKEILESMMGDHAAVLKNLEVVREKDEESGAVVSKFRQPVKAFFDNMRQGKVESLTHEEAERRRRARG